MTHPNFAKFDNAFLDALERPVHLGLKLAERHGLRLTFVERLLSLCTRGGRDYLCSREKNAHADSLLVQVGCVRRRAFG
jgi:hypothetical protein